MVYQVTNAEDFTSKVEGAGDKLVVVDFFATWCGPCKVMVPILEKCSLQYGDKILILKVDVDECEDLALNFNISSMPTFVFIKKGETIHKFSGADPDKFGKTVAQLSDNSSVLE